MLLRGFLGQVWNSDHLHSSNAYRDHEGLGQEGRMRWLGKYMIQVILWSDVTKCV